MLSRGYLDTLLKLSPQDIRLGCSPRFAASGSCRVEPTMALSDGHTTAVVDEPTRAPLDGDLAITPIPAPALPTAVAAGTDVAGLILGSDTKPRSTRSSKSPKKVEEWQWDSFEMMWDRWARAGGRRVWLDISGRAGGLVRVSAIRSWQGRAGR
jgi:hypothetical protein